MRPPIAPGDSAYVDDGSFSRLSIALIPNRPDIFQEGKSVGCFLLHVMPDNGLQVGQIVTPGDQIGTLAGNNGHLHEEISLGDVYHGVWLDDANLVNPLKHANENNLWYADVEDPVIDSVRIDRLSAPTAWKWMVFAHDEVDCRPGVDLDDNNGIFKATLEINGQIVDSLTFDHFTNKAGTGAPAWDEFYCSQDTSRLCHKLTWNRAPLDSLRSWTVLVQDATGRIRGKEWDLGDTTCLDGCASWGCIKACYGWGGGGDGSHGSSWPNPLGCAAGSEHCFPQGVFGGMGGYQLYWPDFDSGAWEYQAWESEEDESSYVHLGTAGAGGNYHRMFRYGADTAACYYYNIASTDSAFRQEVPRPGRGSIIGVGQCALAGVPCHAALDTSGSHLFIAEAEGVLEIVDVANASSPQVVAAHDLSTLGLWQNLFDDVSDIKWDGDFLWVVCGCKGLAVLSFSPDFQAVGAWCRYAVPGTRVSLIEGCGGGTQGEQGSLMASHSYACYVTQEGEIHVLEFIRGSGTPPELNKCGQYTDPWSEDYVARSCYVLTSEEGCYLYISGSRLEPELSGGIVVADISSPCAPSYIFEIQAACAQIEARSGDYLFRDVLQGGFDPFVLMMDVSNPSAPSEVSRWRNGLFEHLASYNIGGPGLVAASDERVYSLGSAEVHYPTGSRHGPYAAWGGLECFTLCGGSTHMFSAAVTDTGFDAAGDTSLVTTTVTASGNRLYLTYAVWPDTLPGTDPPKNRLKVYVDTYEHGDEAAVIGQSPPVDRRIRLAAAHPNPFSTETDMGFSVAAPGRVCVSVYDVAGRLVRILKDGPCLPGTYQAHWDGRVTGGRSAAPGIYFIHFRHGRWSATEKVVLVE
ncbi:MAG: hypothetical protein WAW06_11170 [bacterium]